MAPQHDFSGGRSLTAPNCPLYALLRINIEPNVFEWQRGEPAMA